MTTPKKPKFHVDVSADKVNVKSRLDRLTKVQTMGLKSKLYASQPDVKKAIDTLLADGSVMANWSSQVGKDEAALANSRAQLQVAVHTCDGSYDVVTSNIEKHATVASDIPDTGFDEMIRAKYAVLPPAKVEVAYDRTKETLDVFVTHAPGMTACFVEISPEPLTATSFKRVDGIAAEYHLKEYTPGVYWVRAASVRGADLSTWTVPVAVTVK